MSSPATISVVTSSEATTSTLVLSSTTASTVSSSAASTSMVISIPATIPPTIPIVTPQIIPATTAEVVSSPVVSVGQSLPKPLTELYHESYRLLEADDLQKKAIETFMSISVSPAECDAIEVATQLQRDSEVWKAQRMGRITASSFHDVYTLRDTTSTKSLCKRLLMPKNLSHIPAVKWGIDNEDKARQQYGEEMSSSHESFSCKPSGLVVNPLYPHLGASPDGIISCNCCGTGLLEIKCPYSGNDSHPDSFRTKKRSFLNSQGLVRSHKYYTQVQGQLLICEKKFCDFVIWTTKGLIIERIYIDVRFTEKLSKKLTDFYVDRFLPEILTHKCFDDMPEASGESNDNELYCICQSPEYGKMIQCDNSTCKYVWFHYQCVGIKRAPKGNWLCPDCK